MVLERRVEVTWAVAATTMRLGFVRDLMLWGCCGRFGLGSCGEECSWVVLVVSAEVIGGRCGACVESSFVVLQHIVL